MQQVILWVLIFVYTVLLDAIYLFTIAGKLFDKNLGTLVRRSSTGELAPYLSVAAIVYVLISLGILQFVLPRTNGSVFSALCWGALFGAILYGVYDFTNYATLNVWPIKITLIDFIWGILLCGMVSVLALYTKAWLSR